MEAEPDLTGLDSDQAALVSRLLEKDPQSRPTASEAVALVAHCRGSKQNQVGAATAAPVRGWSALLPDLPIPPATPLRHRGSEENTTGESRLDATTGAHPLRASEPGHRRLRRVLLTSAAAVILMATSAAAATLVLDPSAQDTAPADDSGRAHARRE